MNQKTRTKAQPVHTIGHSNLEMAAFMDLLERNRIQLVTDVRSTPYSRHVPQFNRENLTKALGRQNIGYLHAGELGGRPGEDRLYDEQNRANYRLMAQEPEFQEGIWRIAQITVERRLALLCTERVPLKCHRSLLVAPALEEAGIEVLHILDAGGKVSHEELMDRLLRIQHLPKQSLPGMTRGQTVELAVENQARRVAYRKQ